MEACSTRIAWPSPSNNQQDYALWLWPLDWLAFRFHSFNNFIEASGKFGPLQSFFNIQLSLSDLPLLIEVFMPLCKYKLLMFFKASVPPV